MSLLILIIQDAVLTLSLTGKIHRSIFNLQFSRDVFAWYPNLQCIVIQCLSKVCPEERYFEELTESNLIYFLACYKTCPCTVTSKGTHLRTISCWPSTVLLVYLQVHWWVTHRVTIHPSLFGTVLISICHPRGIILSVLTLKTVTVLSICPNYIAILVINEFPFPTCVSSFL